MTPRRLTRFGAGSAVRPPDRIKAGLARVCSLLAGIATSSALPAHATAETTVAVTQYSYDAMDRLKCTALRMTPSTYGALPASACDQSVPDGAEADRIERNGYDAAGQLLVVERGVGTPLLQEYVRYTYTRNGRRATVKDANGNLATLQYDGFDRLSAWYFPSKSSRGSSSTDDYEQYGYDDVGNRTSLKKRDGRLLTFQYDALGRMTAKLVPDGCAPNQASHCPSPVATRDVFYGYDLQGHQIDARFDSASGADGVRNAYDGFGRLTSSTTAMAGTSRTITARYDVNGNRTQLTTPGGSWSFGYDGLGRLTGLYEGVGTSAALSTWTYNAQGRPDGVVERSGSGVAWTYDGQGRMASQADKFVGGTGNLATLLAYNPADQIVSRTRNNNAYDFDGHYNVNRGYQVNGLNQYTSAGAASFDYDANGNLVNDGSNSYTYDAENRLVSTTAGQSGGTVLSYDPLGRLYQLSGSGVVRQWLYDGDQLTAEYDGAGNLLDTYVHGPGDDDPIVWYPAREAARWFHRDQHGSIVAIAGSSGSVVGINAYDEYGIPNVSNVGRFQFTGQAWLREIGLYHYKARIYSPTLGRFLQTDPIGYDDQVNLYAYAANDPVNKTDPTGNSITEIGFAIYDVAQTISDVRSGASLGTLANDAANIALDVAPVPGLREVKAGVKIGRAVAHGIEGARAAERGAEAARGLPKPPMGPGTVPRAERDPRRNFSPSERATQREAQGGKCANGCGTKIDASNSNGHHITRHSDGGRTETSNHAEVCLPCHKELHSPN